VNLQSLYLLKSLHVLCAAVSISLFCLRGWWHLRKSPRLGRRWVRIAPHVVDAVLLGSGIALVTGTAQWPHTHPWLAAKLAAVVLYIVLGMVAFRLGRRPRTRLAAGVAAVLVFSSIVLLAVTRTLPPF